MATRRRSAPASPLSEPLKPTKARPRPPTLLEQAGDPASVARWKEADAQWSAEASADLGLQATGKMLLLLDQFGIARDHEERWFLLALRLAIEHEPGFKVASDEPRRIGRPKSWTDMLRTDLYCRVQLENADREARGLARSDTDVCRLLAREERWGAWGSQKVLYNQLQLAKHSKMVQMIERIRQHPKIG
ncbi:MAG: hypothetical protein GX886_07230, partial [Comamonadaceae bacterium]|nr:hypothetical protein [Comamonadaceae bacterium]